MGRGFRILHLADSHIGADLPARPRSQRRRRGDDFVDSYRRALQLAETHDVDLVIHAGDVFDRPDPHHSAMAAAAEPLLRQAAAGRPVVIVPGNHERSTLPAFLLFSHPNIHIVREPVTLTFNLRGTRVGVAALPCIRRRSAPLFADTLRATRWEDARADVNLLAVHQTFESATCGPVGFRFRGGEDVIERSAVPREFQYVAAGHIHRHQELETWDGDGPPIVYAGSPDRITLAERDEPKGAMLLEFDGAALTYEFIEHPVRPMRLVPLNLSGFSRARILDELAAQANALPPACIAAFRLSGETSRGTMRGLRLSETLRALRPDVDFTLAVQALEYVPERQIERAARRRAATALESESALMHESEFPPPFENGYESVNAAPNDVELLREATAPIPVEQIKMAPAGCGTYVFFDRQGRVLYVGKANRVRARLRTHLAAKSAAHFAGWTRQIAHVRVRPAYSELEALLVEAELIRRLRPPFNRQMRLWSRYCYICPTAGARGECAISNDPCDEGPCFGPFRSKAGARAALEAANDFFQLAACPPENTVWKRDGTRAAYSVANLCDRYYRGVCAGLCAGRIDEAEYTERLRRRDDLLGGLDDAPLPPIEREFEALDADEELTEVQRVALRRVQTLRAAFDFAALVRMAAGLRGGALLLPGPDAGRIAVLLGEEGICVRAIRTELSEYLRGDSAERFSSKRAAARYATEHAALALLRDHARSCDARRRHWLPKAAAECYVTAARHLAYGTDGYEFVAREVLLEEDKSHDLEEAKAIKRVEGDVVIKPDGIARYGALRRP